MPTFYARRKGDVLVPQSAAARLEFDRLPFDAPLRCEVTQPRNGKFHRLAWALAALLADAINQGPGATMAVGAEDVMRMFKIATGHVDLVRLTPRDAARLKVTHVALPRSISFAAMDEEAFGRFMAAAFAYVADDMAGWLSESPTWPQIEELLRHSGAKVPA